ncbi:MAG: hypothetical protein Q9174_004560 [Haloplaca sp. 1 TL-2023]
MEGTSHLESPSEHSRRTRSRESLEILEKNHQTVIQDDQLITAANVVLPESVVTSSQRSFSGEPEPLNYQTQREYWDNINFLETHKPHLKNVGRKPRAHDHAQFVAFDYNAGNMIAALPHNFENNSASVVKDFTTAILDNVPKDVDTRLLIMDDVSPKLIHILCATLETPPEFFEEHLLNTGWHNDQYEDMAPTTWNAQADFVKDHVSVRWYRPIRARTLRPCVEQESNVMLEPSATPDNWEERLKHKIVATHYTRPLVNIIRSPWEARPGFGGFSAWEERASIWSTQRGQCRILVLLLDPMPLVEHSIGMNKAGQVSERRGLVRNRRRTDTGAPDPEHGEAHHQTSRLDLSGIVQRFWELFKLGSGRIGMEAALSTGPQSESASRSSTQARSFDEDPLPASSQNDCCMFTGYGFRVPLIKQHAPETRLIESTGAALRHLLLGSSQTLVADTQTRILPLEGLLMIMISDTLKILQSIDLILTQMDLNMLDDGSVQVNIDSWRRVLFSFEIELRNMESSIPDLADLTLAPKGEHPRLGSKTTRELFDQFTKQIKRAQERTENTHRSLMTTMSLIESKRGISEAESVTKLTELAFFFIPLTFAASLFSMQVKEINANTTSVGAFLAVALAVTIGSYALRLVIRSSIFLGVWRRWKDEIRAEKEIRPTAPIATSAV